jgi:ABC-2 type transport system ATP-binding protein
LVDKLVAQWELDTKARIGPLSVGQMQKLALVLALGHEPKLLVLDEPVASLDPGGRRAFLRTILDMAMDGETTVLFSTHITSDLERVADRVAILKDGAITYHGELDALKDDVKRLHITAQRDLPATLNIPGTLSEQVNGCEAVATVRGPLESQI